MFTLPDTSDSIIDWPCEFWKLHLWKLMCDDLLIYNPPAGVMLILVPQLFQVIPSIVTLWQDTKCNPPL